MNKSDKLIALNEELKALREKMFGSKREKMDINDITVRQVLIILTLLLDKDIYGDYVTIEDTTYFVDIVHYKFSKCEDSKED